MYYPCNSSKSINNSIQASPVTLENFYSFLSFLFFIFTTSRRGNCCGDEGAQTHPTPLPSASAEAGSYTAPAYQPLATSQPNTGSTLVRAPVSFLDRLTSSWLCHIFARFPCHSIPADAGTTRGENSICHHRATTTVPG
jgi:hypothetical protein